MKDATRAAGHLGRRMPSPPLSNDVIGAPKFTTEPETADNPYQRIAADLRGAITCGALQPGDQLPTVADLANRYSVVVGTAQRAVAVLRSAGLVTVRRGRRAVVTDPDSSREELAEIVNLDVSASSWPTATPCSGPGLEERRRPRAHTDRPARARLPRRGQERRARPIVVTNPSESTGGSSRGGT